MIPWPISAIPDLAECRNLGRWVRNSRLGGRWGNKISVWDSCAPEQLLRLMLARRIHVTVPYGPRPDLASGLALWRWCESPAPPFTDPDWTNFMAVEPGDSMFTEIFNGRPPKTTVHNTVGPGGAIVSTPIGHNIMTAWITWGILARFAGDDLSVRLPPYYYSLWPGWGFACGLTAPPDAWPLDADDFIDQVRLAPASRDPAWNLILSNSAAGVIPDFQSTPASRECEIVP